MSKSEQLIEELESLAGKKKFNKSEELLGELEKLTGSMKLPDHRRSSVKWLHKNMEKFNANHPKFSEAKRLVDVLVKMGY